MATIAALYLFLKSLCFTVFIDQLEKLLSTASTISALSLSNERAVVGSFYSLAGID
jgi:hypothetical protein